MMYQVVKYKYGSEDKYVLHEAIEADGEVYVMEANPEISGPTLNAILNQLEEMRQATLDGEVLSEQQAFGFEDNGLDEEFEELEDEVEDVFEMMKSGRYYGEE